jgi:glycolate oxidase iron-sulfur subunit
VQYGKLIEPFRIAMESTDDGSKADDWFHRLILFGLFTNPARLRRWLKPAKIAQRLRLDRLLIGTGLWKLLPERLGRLVTMLPKLEQSPSQLPNVLPAKGKQRARVALFTGCVADAMFQHVHWATARVLQENGCEVLVNRSQVCCGAIHYHSGQEGPAQEFADTNLAAFAASDVDAIVVNVAGCGAMLRDYGHHWKDDQTDARSAFASKVRDVNEFLDELGLVPPTGPLPITVTYHDACHLAHAQQVRQQPRNLLQQIPDLKLIELPESDLCCGAAGTYNLTEVEMAGKLSRRKMENILSTGARVVATANIGCLMQIACEARMQGEQLPILHPMQLLDLSYRNEPLKF